ncbi:MAG TPA: hypothetical protein VFG83_05485, partial [Kofleriaceae bacterium]|nr:hypothetical protein [Kofleriaceae bacterium]
VAIKDVAAGPKGLLYALDGYDGDLLTVDSRTGRTATFGRCHRPLHVAYAGGLVLVDCLLDHEVRIFSTSAGGVPDPDPVAVIRHDGPIWSMDAAIAGHSLFVALGGVEDHPLFRDGAFGFIDSFVFAYEVDLSTFATERLFAVNVAEHQVITPKWVALSAAAGAALSVDTAGYAGKNRAHIDFAGRGTEPVVTTWPLPPGTTDLVTFSGDQFIAANPLLDAWVVGHGATAVPKVVASQKSGPTRSIDERVGEALFFAGLMAPYNITTGRRSRFTCETCHFDGYIDGRTHYTTRGAVFSVTKPLRGLFNNRPHFSRALDRSMTQMVHNEFRVANAKSGHVPWFAIDTADYPWLRTFGAMPKTLYAIDLRRSLMAFLMIFTHDPNPAVRGRTGFDDREGRGASVFRERCEGCHQARLITDEPSTRVAFDGWEPLIFSPSGSIVWATAEYKKTGVRPYVHPRGARVFSLRRVYRKWPYFTNGSAKSLRAVLERARFSGTPGTDGARFFHDNAPADAHLSSLPAADIDPLIAFLRLL